jgi:hypothetical protein
MSADNKITIAAGAGQGQITALDHGDPMRLVTYNSLGLHYTVNAIQVGLFEFFHGRHTRVGSSRFGMKKHFASKSSAMPALTGGSATASELRNDGQAGLEGGFLKMAARSLMQLSKPDAADNVLKDPDPHASHHALMDAKVLPPHVSSKTALKKLEFGFSGYLQRFDPYGYQDGKNILLRFARFITGLKRYADVAAKYGEAIQSTVLIAEAIKMMELVDGLVKATWKAYHAATDSYPALLCFERTPDGGWSAGTGGVADEYVSGVGTRVAGVASSVQDTRTAEIRSEAQPAGGWDLTSRDKWTLTVSWADGGTHTVSVSTAGARPASLTLTAPALSSQPETKTLALALGLTTYRVALGPADTADVASFAAAIAAAIPAGVATIAALDEAVSITGVGGVSLDGAPGGPVVSWPLAGTSAGVHAIVINGETVEVGLSAANLASLQAFERAVAAAVSDRARIEPDTAFQLLDISAPPRVVKLVEQDDTASLLGRMGVRAEAFENATETLELGPPLLRASGETERLVLHVDGARFTVDLTPYTTLAAALAANAQLAAVASVQGAGNGPVTISTLSASASSRVRVRVDDASRWTIGPSDDERGADAVGQRITASEIVGLLGAMDGVSASTKDDALVLSATKTGTGSRVQASGELAAHVFGSQAQLDEVDGAPDADERAGFGDFESGYKTLISWNHELQKLPEDTRNLTRPLTEAVSDTAGCLTQINNVLKRAQELAMRGAPPPPKTIGMFAPDGITVGTPDRIVGTGGRGVVFIADGGTGDEDRARYVLSENWVKDWMDLNESVRKKLWRIRDTAADDPKVRSLGFRVLSDSAVDLAGTTTAQLAALGRAKVKKPRIDGKQDSVGVGIARVVGSYAAEVVGYEKVVISARGKGTAADDSKMGRVELAGQTIAIGAANRDKWQGNGVHLRLTDFSGAPRFGIERLDLEASKLTGSEHLAGAAWDRMAAEHAQAAWPGSLRLAHPHTEKVVVQGDKIVSRALPFKLEMSDQGMILGFDLELFNEQTQLVNGEVQTLTADIAQLTHEQVREQALQVRLQAAKVLAQGLQIAESIADADRLIAENGLRLQQIATELADKQQRLAAAQLDLQARAAFTDPVPRIELTMDAIRIGFTSPDGKWQVHKPNKFQYQGNWFKAVSKSKAMPFLNLQKNKKGGLHVNPGFVLAEGKATLMNGDGVLEVGVDKASMKFKQGVTAGDGKIKLEVKGGTIKLG